MVLPYERWQARYASGREPPLPPHSASPTFPSPAELPEPHEVQLRAWRTGKRGWSGGLTPSVLMPKPASPTTDPGARPKQGALLFLRLRQAALQGPPGPHRTCALPTKSLRQAQMPSPLSPSRAAACAILQGHFFPPRPFSALVGRAH